LGHQTPAKAQLVHHRFNPHRITSAVAFFCPRASSNASSTLSSMLTRTLAVSFGVDSRR
jgi:hypothetical protein